MKTLALDEHGLPHFEWLVNRGPQKGTLVYYVFDLLMLDGQDVRKWPFAARKTRLEKVSEASRAVAPCEPRRRPRTEMFAGDLALGLEDVVGKDGKSPYIEGPRETWYWLKIKNADYKRQGKVEFK